MCVCVSVSVCGLLILGEAKGQWRETAEKRGETPVLPLNTQTSIHQKPLMSAPRRKTQGLISQGQTSSGDHEFLCLRF